MRNRFNAYTPFYHRSLEVRPTSHSKKDVAVNRLLDQISFRDVEHLVRCLVTLISLQERRFVGFAFPALTLLIDPAALKKWTNSGKEPRARGSPFAAELQLLHAIGAIDAFKLGEPFTLNADSTRAHAQNPQIKAKATFASLAHAARAAIIGQRAAEYSLALDETALETVVSTERVNELADTQWTRRPGGETVSLTAACLDAYDRSAGLLSLKLKNLSIPGHMEIGGRIAADYYFNLAFLNWGLFLRRERRLVVVRDYPFFRRVVAGGEEWMEELCARVHLRSGGGYPLRWEGGEARFDNYLRHIEAFALSSWGAGRDVDYSGPDIAFNRASWFRKRSLT
jgi:hypothetical protein